MRSAIRWVLCLSVLTLACNPGPLDDDHDGTANSEDCDASNPLSWRIVSAHPDADRDGHGGDSLDRLCIGANLPRDHAWSSDDCDDEDPGAWTAWRVFADTDDDGLGAGEEIVRCGPTSLPQGFSLAAGDCAPEDARRWQELAYAFRDADGDGRTVSVEGLLCTGAALPAGYSSAASGDDCDDADASVWAEVRGYQDLDGDAVGSGALVAYCTKGALPTGNVPAGGDCAPNDPARWRELSYQAVDLDGDGYGRHEPGVLCAGPALPPGYLPDATSASDCDDHDADAWRDEWAYADTDGDGAGEGSELAVCVGFDLPSGYDSAPRDCAPDDASRWTARPAYPDVDGDGVGADSIRDVCSGAALPAGFASSAGDCAPQDRTRWREWSYAFRDSDGDGKTVPSSGTLCIGETSPAGYSTEATGSDCDDARAAVFVQLEGFPDTDGDGAGSGLGVPFCTSGMLPEGYALTGSDCAEDDPSLWQVLEYVGVDQDGDGHTVAKAGTVCTGTTLPLPYYREQVGNDCDDADPDEHRWLVLYPDQDADGVGSPPRSVFCLGAAVPEGWSLFGFDPDDADASVEDVGESEESGLILE